MEVKKDIGKAFREKLDNLDRLPGDALWDSISKDLDKKKKRKFPFLWFYICGCGLLAIVFVTYMLSHAGSDNNTAGTKQESLQNGSSISSPVTTAIESPSVNKGTIKDDNVNSMADSQNKTSDATVTDAISTNTTGSAGVRNNDKKNGNKSQAVIRAVASSKTNGQKNTTTTGTYLKQKTQHFNGSTAATRNTKVRKTRRINKNNPTPLYTVLSKTSSASAKENDESGYSAAATLSKRKNLTTSETSEEKAHFETEAQTSKASGNIVAVSSAITGNENVTREGTSLTVHDSLPENMIVAKDSLKTELPKEKEETKKDSLAPAIVKRFSIFAFAGPSYFSFPNRTIRTDSTTANISASNTLNYGVLFGYRINNKLSIRTGISFYKLKQSAYSIKLNYVMGGNDAIHPELIPTADFYWIDYKYPFGQNSSLIINTLGSNYQAIINIDRNLSYFQAPLELNYTLLDKKFGIILTGGGSLLLQTKNEVYAYNETGKMYLGKWNAAAKTSFTGILGLGLNYKIAPSLQINAEPVFNYYFNTYKDSKPYSFNIRLGLQYNFDLRGQKK